MDRESSRSSTEENTSKSSADCRYSSRIPDWPFTQDRISCSRADFRRTARARAMSPTSLVRSW